MANSLDAVSARDFALETLAAAAICATHLSRLAEEIVIWFSAGFGFVKLSDSFTTGSSIMPQKRNPDAAELVRAKAGRVAGAFAGLLMVMKGLPLAYSKDMQEDKEAVFSAIDALSLGLAAMTGMIEDMEPDAANDASRCGARLLDRDRPCGLARPARQAAVPRGPSRDGPHREGSREGGRGPRPSAACCHAKNRAPHRCQRVRGARCREVGGEQAKLWGHSSGKCARGGEKLDEDAGVGGSSG